MLRSYLWQALAFGALTALACGAGWWLTRTPGEPPLFSEVATRPGPRPGQELRLVHARLAAADPAFRDAAGAYAAQWDPKGRLRGEDVAVPFYDSLPAAQIGTEFEAVLTYCMHRDRPPAWSPGKGECFERPKPGA